MASPSEESPLDYNRFDARTQHVLRSSSPQPQPSESVESDFTAVGGQFPSGERRESYPHHLEFSEGEDIARQPSSPSPGGPSNNASLNVGRSPSLGSSPTTPVPNPPHRGPYLQPSDLHLVHRKESRKARKRRIRSAGRRARRSEDGSTDGHPHSDTTSVDGDDNERERSSTPTPYFAPSNTPSQRSEETEEDHGEGKGPVSPSPYSAYSLYNPARGKRALHGFKESFRDK